MLKKVIGIVIAAAILVSLSSCMITRGAKGEFYSLREASENGWLTKADLENIAGRHNGELFSAHVPELSAETESEIKETAARKLREQPQSPIEEAKAEDIAILRYYGTYNGCVAVMIADSHHHYPDVEVDESETISGVSFHYRSFDRIVIWSKRRAAEQASAISELNANFDGEYGFASEPPSAELYEQDGFVFKPGMMGGNRVVSADGATEYNFSGFPDVRDGYRVTFFRTQDTKYTLFGFSVGDSIEEAAEALRSRGYAEQEDALFFKKGVVWISLFTNGAALSLDVVQTVGTLQISLDATNRDGIVF